MGDQICLEKLLKDHPDLENDQVLFSFPQFLKQPQEISQIQRTEPVKRGSASREAWHFVRERGLDTLW